MACFEWNKLIKNVHHRQRNQSFLWAYDLVKPFRRAFILIEWTLNSKNSHHFFWFMLSSLPKCAQFYCHVHPDLAPFIDGFQSTGFYKLNCNFFSCLFNTFFSVGCCLLHFRTIRRLIQKILLHKCHHISDWIPLLSQIFETCATGERMSERRKNCMQKSI